MSTVNFALPKDVMLLSNRDKGDQMQMLSPHSIYALQPLLKICINPLNAELNSICYLLALLGGATIVVVSSLMVK
jgi:hypothetical protein